MTQASFISQATRAEAARAAGASAGPAVSVIVPTFREVLNIPRLVDRLEGVRRAGAGGEGIDLDVWFMDDRSGDGSVQAAAGLGREWVRLVERSGTRGLSPAVIEGMRSSAGRTIIVMDADLSHPAETIPALLDALDRGADMAFGSRYVEGGSTQDGWGLHRKANSLLATLLARPLTKLKDPMSGFFALRRTTFERAARLDPIGYKIGLELVVKCRASRVVEVPIRFANREAGQSKLTPVQQLKYLEHLRRLYLFKFGPGSRRAVPEVVVTPKFRTRAGN